MIDKDKTLPGSFLYETGVFSYANAPMNFPHLLTIERLAEQAEAFKAAFPILPPYYRVNTKTYNALMAMSVRRVPRLEFTTAHLGSIEFRIDDTVPDGDALPPIPEIKFVPRDPISLDASPSFKVQCEEILIEEAKERWPDMFEEKKEEDDGL